MSMISLLRLETGQPDVARRAMERYLAKVSTPLEIADALCTRARIEAAAGHEDRAARALREAQRFAPWYTRVAIVRARLGIDSVDTLSDPNVAQLTNTVTRDTLADPWATPRR
jgi:lipopolysaccharide biosynthesis regulator YciM